MKVLAIIPARGGSKRIPRKNIKIFKGKPMIAWPIETAIKSNLFDEIMVSTEDAEIAIISKEFGAQVPFFRSICNSGDDSGTEEVIFEVLNQYRLLGKNFDYVCCIYPTTPLITKERLLESKAKLIDGNFDTVLPLLRYGHPVQRSIKNQLGKARFVWPKFVDYRTQDLEIYFHDSGQFYWIRVDSFLEKKELFTDNTGFIELTEFESQDIDNQEDWEMAILKHDRFFFDSEL
jgi:pseudaminic acid cytidylyltransferase